MKNIFVFITVCFVLLSLSNGYAEDQGEKKWAQFCSACHTKEPPPNIAPPVRGIVMHYRGKYKSEEEFTNAIVAFVTEPSQEKSLLPGAIDRFHLMPPLPIPKEDIADIARWMWSSSR